MRLFKKRFKSDHLAEDDKWIKLYYKLFEYQIWCIKCKIGNWRFKRYIKKQIRKGYLDKDLAPLKCPFCDYEDLETYESIYENHMTIETWVRCKKCQKHVGTWAYGGWVL